jgi:hypothetical protein
VSVYGGIVTVVINGIMGILMITNARKIMGLRKLNPPKDFLVLRLTFFYKTFLVKMYGPVWIEWPAYTTYERYPMIRIRGEVQRIWIKYSRQLV